jgi:hypothetical protein
MLTEGFLIFLVTSIITCCLTTSRMLYKSKCRSVDCCGIKIVRDVAVEEHLDQAVPRTTSMATMQPTQDFV